MVTVQVVEATHQVLIHEETVGGCAVAARRFKLNEIQRNQSLVRLMNYPLPHVEWRLQKEGRVPTDNIEEALIEWRRFMATVLYSNGSVSMISPIVDEVWHAHILFTKEYAEFCQAIYGQFIGHVPNWPGAPTSAGGVQRFVKSYQSLFGTLPDIWTAHHQTRSECYEEPPDCDECSDCDTPAKGDEECGVSCYDCNSGNEDDCTNQ